LLHHSVQLKIDDWKQIRKAIFKNKKPTQINLEVDNEREMNRSLAKYWYRDHKDYLDVREQYDSLFLIGSKEVFNNISIDAMSVYEEGRDLFSRFPGYHAHEHIDYYVRREYTKNFKYDGWTLSLDFYDSGLWER
jgi:hypothetical protein